MKSIISTIALSLVLVAGAASASINFEVEQLSDGTTIQTGSHYSSKELITIHSANLQSNNHRSDLLVGNK